MVAASLLGIFCGMTLGLRFKAFLLVPAIVLAAMAAALTTGTGFFTFAQAGFALLSWSMGLQFGYGATLAAGLLGRQPVR